MIYVHPDTLSALGVSASRATQLAGPLTQTAHAYSINTERRMKAWLARLVAETGALSVVEENLNYSASALRSIWPSHFPTSQLAKQYERKPEAIANRAYANRMLNGNEASGDGWRYRGRGYIQITGRDKYRAYTAHIARTWPQVQQRYGVAGFPPDFERNPDLVASAPWSYDSAGWYVEHFNPIQHLADAGRWEDYSRAVNGGSHGMSTFLAALPKIERAMLGQPVSPPVLPTIGPVGVSQAGVGAGSTILDWLSDWFRVQLAPPQQFVSATGSGITFNPVGITSTPAPSTGGYKPPVQAPTGTGTILGLTPADLQLLLIVGAAGFFIREARRASKRMREADA